MSKYEFPNDRFSQSESIINNGGYYISQVSGSVEKFFTEEDSLTSLKYCSAFTKSFSDAIHFSVYSITGTTSSYWIHAITKLQSYNDYVNYDSIFSSTGLSNIIVFNIPKIYFGDRIKEGTFEITLSSGEKFISSSDELSIIPGTDAPIDLYPYNYNNNESLISNLNNVSITSFNGVSNIEINKLNYYYLEFDKLNFSYKDKSFIQERFHSFHLAKKNADNILNYYWNELATINDISGKVYVLNLLNVSSVSYSLTSISVNFSNNALLNINCVDNDSLYANKLYLNDLIFARDIKTYITTQNKLYIHQNNVENISGGIYNDLRKAITNKAANDVLILQSGSYFDLGTTACNLTSSTTFYFEDNSTIDANNVNIFSYSGSLESQSIKILGKGNILGSGISYQDLSTSGVDIFIQANSLNSLGKMASSGLSANLRAKIYSINKNSGVVFDSNSKLKNLDVDCFNILSTSSLTYFYNSLTSNIIFRNFNFSNSVTSSIISVGGSGGKYKLNLINCNFKQGYINLYDNTNNVVNLWNTSFLNNDNIFINSSGGYSTNLNFYGYNYSNNLYPNYVVTSGLVNLIVDSELSFDNSEILIDRQKMYLNSDTYGNIFGKLYSHEGFGILWNNSSTSFSNSSNMASMINSISAVKWQTEILHTEMQIFVTKDPFELNYTKNPSAFKSLKQSLSGYSYNRDSLTGWNPEYIESLSASNTYMTTINYYNEKDECIITSKLSKPVRLIKELPYSFRSIIDLNII